MPSTLVADSVHAGYDSAPVLRDVSVDLTPGGVTVLVGPNGSGKSTLLRTLARLHDPTAGAVTVDGEDAGRLRGRELARRLAFLPQGSPIPAGLTVRELVGHGRYAHRGALGRVRAHDHDAVDWALEVTGTTAFAGRHVDGLSGGERQRAWIAMVLAQQTGVLLLDEPTTYLDLRYQVEVLALVRSLADEHGITVGLVLHDLNQAAAYADQVVVLSDGTVLASGTPDQVLTGATIETAFGLPVHVVAHPLTGRPTCLPYGSPAPAAMAS
ncbi:iron complex transport system ATP-binding protein [Haloactinopolyspora alba]|uniref:Iron complex transport system ATP-binding protein n=1 Tax=Haloactinopolyspora alba TaxID=648780 RepID=A0A2P8E103_9ACTN|nr:ABC transporter ATP-binding protein [Haloactinopolyspora alba]PSL03162.1 iron complex transport system ATP-binding protein [Haloactinopolyspora alba]